MSISNPKIFRMRILYRCITHICLDCDSNVSMYKGITLHWNIKSNIGWVATKTLNDSKQNTHTVQSDFGVSSLFVCFKLMLSIRLHSLSPWLNIAMFLEVDH